MALSFVYFRITLEQLNHSLQRVTFGLSHADGVIEESQVEFPRVVSLTQRTRGVLFSVFLN